MWEAPSDLTSLWAASLKNLRGNRKSMREIDSSTPRVKRILKSRWTMQFTQASMLSEASSPLTYLWRRIMEYFRHLSQLHPLPDHVITLRSPQNGSNSSEKIGLPSARSGLLPGRLELLRRHHPNEVCGRRSYNPLANSSSLPRFREPLESMLVQALGPQPSVEALDVALLQQLLSSYNPPSGSAITLQESSA